MDYRDNRQRWAESHQVVHFYAGQWCTFTPALTGCPAKGKGAGLVMPWCDTDALMEQFAGYFGSPAEPAAEIERKAA